MVQWCGVVWCSGLVYVVISLLWHISPSCQMISLQHWQGRGRGTMQGLKQWPVLLGVMWQSCRRGGATGEQVTHDKRHRRKGVGRGWLSQKLPDY